METTDGRRTAARTTTSSRPTSTTSTTEPGTTTAGATTDRTARHGLTVRARITASVGLLVLVALSGAGAIVYALERSNVDAAATNEIQQEFDELDAFLSRYPAPTGGQRPADLEDRLRGFLRNNVPDDQEVLVGWVHDGPALRIAGDDVEGVGESLSSNPDFLSTARQVIDGRTGIARFEMPSYGEVVVAAQTVRQGDVRGALVIATFMDLRRADLVATMRTYAIVALLSLLLITALAAGQSGRLLAPVRVLRETADDISESDLSLRLPEVGNDDITALTRTFNAMLARLEAAFVGQRQFLDDAGHELKTPLTVLQGHLELMDVDDPREVAETRQLLLDEVDRMSRLVGDLILLAKSDRPDFLTTAPVSLERLTHTLLSKARGLADRAWVLDAAGEAVVTLDEQRVTQAVLQLADNAVKHTVEGDEVAIGSAVDGDAVRIWVRDTGPGVPESDRDHVFERFGRSVVGPGDEGFGLGLSIVRAIADAHHGRVEVDPGHSPGARFVITLPTDPEASWPAS